MAGQAILELEKPTQERLLRLRKQAHIHRALPAAQNRAQRDRQNLMKVVQRGIAGARVVQTVPAFDKAIQNNLPRRKSSATGRIHLVQNRKKTPRPAKNSKCDSPGPPHAIPGQPAPILLSARRISGAHVSARGCYCPIPSQFPFEADPSRQKQDRPCKFSSATTMSIRPSRR